jgi:putative peptide zinc metalloprotease protein
VDEAGSGVGDTWGYHVGATKIRLGRARDNDVVLKDRRVSLHHAVLSKDAQRRWVVDDLDSQEGTFLNDLRVTDPVPLQRGDVIRLGHSAIRLVEDSADALRPERAVTDPSKGSSPPDRSGSARDLHPRLGGGVSAQSPLSRKDVALRPQTIPGWTLEHLLDEDGREYYVLSKEAAGSYLRLTERDAFLWKRMDGQHSVRDLLVAFLAEYHALGTERLFDLLSELADHGFLSNVAPQRPAPTGRFARARARVARVTRRLLQVEFAIRDADRFLTSIYQKVGWPLYTKAGQAGLGILTVTGLAAFVVVMVRGGQSLFQIEGSTAAGLAVLAVATWVTILVHELGHALSTKTYNRRVRRAGVMLYYGFVAFFVDTSDIWMEPRGPRIRASLAGPYSGLIVAGGASLVVLAAPETLAAAILFKLAAWSYITVALNLNPLLELDGYFVLVDWMEMPLLRRRALAFLRAPLWGKIRKWEPLTRHEWWLTTFGGLSAAWSAVALVAGIVLWRRQTLDLLHGGATGRIVLGLGLLAVAVGILASVVTRRRRARAAADQPVSGPV